MNLQTPLAQTIAMLSHLMAQLEAEAFEQEGFSELSMRQVLYMEIIAKLERPTFSELAEKLGITKPSVTTLVRKLIRMGYVKKVQSDQDRRVYHIVLDEKGQQFTEMHANIHRLLAARLTENLNEVETQQLNEILLKVTQA
jgi:DNA-binding MarR family transcriptional regulator